MLEELLAKMLQDSGYSLLVHQSQDPAALTAGSNGLRVRGRGADHQADVLGDLNIDIPFSFPMRLFVEAKFKSTRIGLADVRNAVGVLNDVNEHYSADRARLAAGEYERFVYRYALFSASGFSSDAQHYALTQQISLIDLSESAFAWLLEAVRRTSIALLALAVSEGATSFPVQQLRQQMRQTLDTWTLNAETSSGPIPNSLPSDRVAEIVRPVLELDARFFIGLTNTPFLLVVQTEDSSDFHNFLESSLHAVVPASLKFAGEDPDNGEWVLVPEGLSAESVLRMGIPAEFESILLTRSAASVERRGPHEQTGESVRIYAYGKNLQIKFEPIQRHEGEAESQDTSRYRRSRFTSRFRATTDRPSQPHRWSRSATKQLLTRLRTEAPIQASVILRAAVNGGSIERDELYLIAQFSETRSLRGFTRPTRRITQNLIEAGLLDAEAQMPLLARYRTGVLATHYVIPPEFVEYLS